MHEHSDKPNSQNGPGQVSGVSDDVLRRILSRMADRDPAEAPDLSGAISAILASRLEGTPIPESVRATVEALDPGAASTGSNP